MPQHLISWPGYAPVTKSWPTSVGKSSTAKVSLAEVFHPWVCWEGPGSGFESSSSAGGGGAQGHAFVGFAIE